MIRKISRTGVYGVRRKLLVLGMSVCAAVAATSLSACAILQGFDPVMAMSDADKENLLREQLTKFNRAVYWGTTGEVAEFLSPQIRSQFLSDEYKRRERERLVNSDVVNVDYRPLEDSAEVELMIRFYEQPRYVVETRKERQTWKFDRFKGGWQVTERTFETASEPGSDVTPTRARFAPSVMPQQR